MAREDLPAEHTDPDTARVPRDAGHQSPHATDPTGRFTSRADDYVHYRPTYPPDAIAAILDGVGALADTIVADIGAGTGISSRLIADLGPSVFAIEPNDAMRAAAGPHPRVTWGNATAEATRLSDHSVDLVLAAQAFHWFRPDQSLHEFHRILRPAGRLALMWNVRDESDPFTAAYSLAVHRASDRPADRGLHLTAASVDASTLFRVRAHSVFPNGQPLDLNGLIGRARSASYVPKTGPRSTQLEQELRMAFDTYASPEGGVVLRHHTHTFTFSPTT